MRGLPDIMLRIIMLSSVVFANNRITAIVALLADEFAAARYRFGGKHYQLPAAAASSSSSSSSHDRRVGRKTKKRNEFVEQ